MKRLSALLALLITLAVLPIAATAFTEIGTITLYPGENWISPPLAPIDFTPTSIFAGLNINANLTRFDPITQKTVTYTSVNPALFGNILLGEGYKINYTGSTPMAISYIGVPDGIPSDPNNPLTTMTDMWISLPGDNIDNKDIGGMHWIGQPFNHNSSISSFLVTDGSIVLSVREAINRGWLDSIWHGFDASTQTGFTVGLSEFGADQTYFRPGQMYQIGSHVDNLALVIPAYVPEPSSILAIICGLSGFYWVKRKRV